MNQEPSLDLASMARRAMLEAGFQPDIPLEAEHEAHTALDILAEGLFDPPVQDLRKLLWSSLDSIGSLDLDQVEFAEKCEDGSIRLLVGIADVDLLAKRASAIDLHAFMNTTTVYTPAEIFPMLPEELSTFQTSLLEGEERLAVVIEMMIASDGSVRSSDVFHAILTNHAQLDYQSVGEWLEGRGPLPNKIASIPRLEEQIRLQDKARLWLTGLRQHNGALNVETIQAVPVTEDGKVVGIEAEQHNLAQDIIESFMISANTVMAEFLEKAGALSIRRVVHTPRRWDRIVDVAAGLGERLPPEPDARLLSEFMARRKLADPDHFPDLSLTIIKLLGPGEYTVDRQGLQHEGHFGLAVHDYTHSTAPNRRYADLVTQRLVKAVLENNTAPYTEAELGQIAMRCNERESAAKKVERRIDKAAAALLLRQRIGETFEGIITGASPKGTWVRLFNPPVEGRVIHGESGLDVGDKIQVRLVSTEPELGFIDFEHIS